MAYFTVDTPVLTVLPAFITATEHTDNVLKLL